MVRSKSQCREHDLKALECAQKGKSGDRRLGGRGSFSNLLLPFTDPEIERESAGASRYPSLLYTPARKVLT
jgi:hypothetical protein